MVTPSLALAVFTLTTVALWLPAWPQEVCSGQGELHGNHCHCKQGYTSEGVECIPRIGTTASCPPGGIAWELSMAMALETGIYNISLVNNTEHMAMFVLPLNLSMPHTVTRGELEASVEQSTRLLDDVALMRYLVNASRAMAPTDHLLYVVQRSHSDTLATRQGVATEPILVNLVVDRAGYYAFHLQHNAIEEFGMQVLDAAGQEVAVALSLVAEEGKATAGTRSAQKATTAVWSKALVAVAIVTILAAVGILLLIFRIRILTKVMDAMIALSAGALFGAAFLHILPEAIEFHSELGHMDLTLSMVFTGGFVGAMIVEMALELWVSVVQDGESHTHGPIPTTLVRTPSTPALDKDHGTPEPRNYHDADTEPHFSPDATSVPTLSLHVNWHAIKPMAYIILLGDLFHNFVDGVLIATAFLACDDSLGISVTLSSILHELPQEFADFIILLDAGFTPFQAVLFNCLSALSAFMGAVVVLAAVPVTNETMGLLLAVGSGTLVYIAGTDLLPRVLHVKSRGQFGVNVLMFAIGVGVMALTSLHHVHCNAD